MYPVQRANVECSLLPSLQWVLNPFPKETRVFSIRISSQEVSQMLRCKCLCSMHLQGIFVYVCGGIPRDYPLLSSSHNGSHSGRVTRPPGLLALLWVDVEGLNLHWVRMPLIKTGGC